MSTARYLLSGALLALTFVYLQFFTATEIVPIRRSLDELPMTVGEWRGAETTILQDAELEVLRPTDYVVRRYVDPGSHNVWLYVGYWGTQRKGAQIHSPKNCLPGGGWEPLEAKRDRVPLAGGNASIEVNHYVLQKGPDRLVVLYWFESEGRAIASEIDAKIALVRSAALRNRTDGAVVRVSIPVVGDTTEASDLLVKFVQSLYPMLGEFLPP